MLKKNILGIKTVVSLLLLLLSVLGLSTTCYATNYDDIPEDCPIKYKSYLNWQDDVNNSNYFVILLNNDQSRYEIITSSSPMYVYLSNSSYYQLKSAKNDSNLNGKYNLHVFYSSNANYNRSFLNQTGLNEMLWSNKYQFLYANYTLKGFRSVGSSSLTQSEYDTYEGDQIFFLHVDPEPELPDLFNGKIETYYNQDADRIYDVMGSCDSYDGRLCFEYNTNYIYSSGDSGYFSIFLEELSAHDAFLQTDYCSGGSPASLHLTPIISVIGRQVSYNINYSDILSLMKNGYIYRLYFYFYLTVNNRTILLRDICTSEFFSKDSWTSDKIIVKNIYDIVGGNNFYSGEDGSLFIVSRSGDSGDLISRGIFDIQNSIVDLNKNITGTIDNVILGTPNESGDRQGGLVGNLLEGLWNGFVHLFVPNSDEFHAWLDDTIDELSESGGFLLYSKNFWISLVNLINNSEDSDFILSIPEFSLPNLRFRCKWSSYLGG